MATSPSTQKKRAASSGSRKAASNTRKHTGAKTSAKKSTGTRGQAAAARRSGSARKAPSSRKRQVAEPPRERVVITEDDLRDNARDKRTPSIGRIVAVVAVALAFIGVAGLIIGSCGDDEKNQSAITPGQAAPPEPNSPSEVSRMDQLKDHFAGIGPRKFRQLATPQVNHSKNGRFIDDASMRTKSPSEKYEAILTAAAEDRTTLVGLLQVFAPGAYDGKGLTRILKSTQGGRRHYNGWSDLRDIFVHPRFNIRNTKLNGKWFNGGLASNGVVTSTTAVWKNEPAMAITVPTMKVNGKVVKGNQKIMRDLCSNEQKRKPFGIQTRTPGDLDNPIDNPRNPVDRNPGDNPNDISQPDKPTLQDVIDDNGLNYVFQPKPDRPDSIRCFGCSSPEENPPVRHQDGPFVGQEDNKSVPAPPADSQPPRPAPAPDVNNTQPGPGDSNNQTENPGSGSGQSAPTGQTETSGGNQSAPAPTAPPEDSGDAGQEHGAGSDDGGF